LAPPSDLHSSFRPTYNFTANLMNHFDQETAHEVMQRSYAQFEADHRPSGSKRPLSEQLTARWKVLDELGYAEGWKLNAQGQVLRSIYHENDLLIAETIAAGVLENLEPAQLAGLLSVFTFQGRKGNKQPLASKQVQARKRATSKDRLGQERRGNLRERSLEIAMSAATIAEVEARHRVPHAKEPDDGFATTIAAWARGATLGVVLDLADAEIGHTSPGDFVRNAKQVGDLLEQLSRMRHVPELAANAEEAKELVVRSVVAGF